MGDFEIHSVFGHLECMEFMVQPTRSYIKDWVFLCSKIIRNTLKFIILITINKHYIFRKYKGDHVMIRIDGRKLPGAMP